MFTTEQVSDYNRLPFRSHFVRTSYRAQHTKGWKYRVEIGWTYRSYHIDVRRLSDGRVIRSHAAFSRRTTIVTANKFLHQFGGQ